MNAEFDFQERFIHYQNSKFLAYWQTIQKVDEKFNQLKTTEGMEAVKENILIWVVGFKLDDYKITWSKEGKKRPVL